MFEIELTPEAKDDLDWLRKYEQQGVLGAIATQLHSQPLGQTRNRKRLRPNPLAEWELRVGRVRVFHDVDREASRVKIKAIGYKEGNELLRRGEEMSL